ncbi:MAG TPA: hypothetical protein VMG99_06540 [Thermoplasmata archaeon]|nr:hypothetical protein [Thermoplasmata archaeon]
MDQPRRLAGGHAGIALLILGLTVGLAFAFAIPGSAFPVATDHAGTAPAALATGPSAPAAPQLAPQPSAASPTQVSLQVNSATTVLSTYTVLPTTIVLNLTVFNSTISTSATGLWLNITDYVTHVQCVSNDLSSMITNQSAPTEYIAFPLTPTYFAGYETACPNLLADPTLLNLTAVQVDPTNGTMVTTGYEYGTYNPLFPPGWGVLPVSSFILSAPTSKLNVAPTPGVADAYTLSVNYTGQYTGRVLLTVVSPTGGTVLSTNLANNGTKPTTYQWTETITGLYSYVLTVYTTYGTYNSTGSISISNTPIYYNNATFTNTSLIKGLNGGAAGTLLLVVGLVIGMLVATVVSRMVWGGSKSAAPAQAWSPSSPTTNQCSVCGKSMATPEELAAHQKSEHGMQ